MAPPLGLDAHTGPEFDPAAEAAVHEAVASIDDPEYPGVSIVDLGLLESLSLEAGRVEVGLIPTFSGCPALAVIAEDVVAAVSAVPGVTGVDVSWLAEPAWTPERISHDARRVLADSFTVAVELSPTGSDRAGVGARCPRCGAVTDEQSMFGPSRCRAVHRCPACAETVEVIRG